MQSPYKQDSYKVKYKKMKNIIKQQLFINAALCDEISECQRQFIRTKAERKYLLKKLFEYLPMSESQVIQSTKALDALEKSNPGKIPRSILSPDQPDVIAPLKKKVKLQSNKTTLLAAKNSTAMSQDPTKEACKPKRKKPGTVKKRVQPLPMDELGVPLFPITLGTLCVYDLGEVISSKPGFHSDRYIWPVGFCSTRLYPSMSDPEHRIRYFCYIKDGGSEPLFEIVPEDEPSNIISAATATACHCVVLKRLNAARGKIATNTGSGPEFFGFSHPTIQYLIQCLPRALQCDKYHRQSFELGSANTNSPENVIRDDNFPDMHQYDRTNLELPHIAC